MTTSNVRLSLPQFVAFNKEVDLARPEMLQDIKSIQGVPGGPSQLHMSYMRRVCAFAMFPFLKMYDDVVRDFAVCPAPPDVFRDLGPGVIVCEGSVPAGLKEYEGFQIHPPPRGIRMENQTLHYLTSGDLPETTTITTYVRVSLPIFQSLVPLNLGAQFLVGMGKANHLRLKEQLADRFQDLGYQQRMAEAPQFYSTMWDM